jgi:predicted nucleic acid-binding protein
MLILDTNVVSALRRPHRHRHVASWVHAQQEQDLYLSAITIGELERGLALKKRRQPGSATGLEAWVQKTIAWYFDRIIPFGREEARLWGRLSATLGNHGSDIQIAATAIVHGATLATRNVRHFAPTGVPVVDPFDASPR